MRDGDIDSLSADAAQETKPSSDAEAQAAWGPYRGGKAMTFKLEQTEAQFQAAVQELATAYGWAWMHIEPGRTQGGYWRTPVKGTLGRGFPDLLMVKGQRMIAAELKSLRGRFSGPQEQVLGLLTGLGYVEVYRWYPADWDHITEVLSASDRP